MTAEFIPCPVCVKTPAMRPGVCENEIELHHKCLMGHIVNRGDFGDVWKTEKRAAKEWARLCRIADTQRNG